MEEGGGVVRADHPWGLPRVPYCAKRSHLPGRKFTGFDESEIMWLFIYCDGVGAGGGRIFLLFPPFSSVLRPPDNCCRGCVCVCGCGETELGISPARGHSVWASRVTADCAPPKKEASLCYVISRGLERATSLQICGWNTLPPLPWHDNSSGRQHMRVCLPAHDLRCSRLKVRMAETPCCNRRSRPHMNADCVAELLPMQNTSRRPRSSKNCNFPPPPKEICAICL